MKKFKLFTQVFIIVSMITGATAFTWATDYFDTADQDKGLIHITYKSASTAKMKVMIEKNPSRYTYDINSAGVTESFPLQSGSGTYKISLLQNTSGNSYKLIASKSVTATIKDPNAVYLNSIQNISFNVDSAAVKKAVELTKGTDDIMKKAKILWNYMANNNKYDFKKLSLIRSSYVPVVDETLRDQTGICYDFSALFAAMLRSQGIPAKLIMGYAPNYANGYHAWNEVYDAAAKKWITIDATYDLQVIKIKPKAVEMIKTSSEYQKIYEY
jgi:transglutaminase-like putative cysteine protease